jgi:hypothetical protein
VNQVRMVIRVRVLDLMGMGTVTMFYLWVTLVSDLNRDGYEMSIFFPPADNPTGIRYFTTAIILCCEQVKMCSFCYINY